MTWPRGAFLTGAATGMGAGGSEETAGIKKTFRLTGFANGLLVTSQKAGEEGGCAGGSAARTTPFALLLRWYGSFYYKKYSYPG